MVVIPKGKVIYLIKVVDKGEFDSIRKHRDVISERGFVWLGKIGNIPSEKDLIRLDSDSPNYLIVKNREKLYLCEYSNYSYMVPEQNYPDYYKEIFDLNIFNLWFRISIIVDIDSEDQVKDIVLCSDKSNRIVDASKRSMNSYFRGVSLEEVIIE